jgi:hypothetical protein
MGGGGTSLTLAPGGVRKDNGETGGGEGGF